MKFSICVPNYNYGHYLGQTLESVRAQAWTDIEILVSDNASTDDSADVVRAFADPRIRLSVNRWNLGFAGNLDRAASYATGDFMVLLSSDDRMEPDALSTLGALIERVGVGAPRTVFGSTVHVIDGHNHRTGRVGIDWKLWRGAERDPDLSAVAGADVFRLPASVLLNSSMKMMRAPFHFLSTCYPRDLYDAVEGYGAQRLMNPDKWFTWKLLCVADTAIIVDRPLFSYRVHASNQNAVQKGSGALKHLVDQYVSTFDVAPRMLDVAGLTTADLANAFVEHDIALRGLVALSNGDRVTALRGLRLGEAAYPDITRRNTKVWALRALLALGPLGVTVAKAARARTERRWSDALSGSRGGSFPP